MHVQCLSVLYHYLLLKADTNHNEIVIELFILWLLDGNKYRPETRSTCLIKIGAA